MLNSSSKRSRACSAKIWFLPPPLLPLPLLALGLPTLPRDDKEAAFFNGARSRTPADAFLPSLSSCPKMMSDLDSPRPRPSMPPAIARDEWTARGIDRPPRADPTEVDEPTRADLLLADEYRSASKSVATTKRGTPACRNPESERDLSRIPLADCRPPCPVPTRNPPPLSLSETAVCMGN